MNMIVELIIFYVLFFIINGQMDKNKYGPYNLNFLEFTKCKGPKQSDCGANDIENTQNMSDVVFKLNYKDNDCPITTTKITISIPQDNSTMKKLFNYALEKPCQHFVLGPILIRSFNLTNSCKINKGPYEIHLNMQEKAETFLGPNFFYGTFNFKIMIMNKSKNIVCVNSKLTTQKRSP